MKSEDDCGQKVRLSAELGGSLQEPERFFPAEFEVWLGGEHVYGSCGQRDEALLEVLDYAAQCEPNEPVRIFEVTRTLVTRS